MKKTLEKAAKAGRHGDNRLLHVSQEEIDGLASLLPNGKLPVNPKTGLHEAFFFLPALAALGAAAAPAAAGAGALAAGTLAAAAPAAAAAAAPLAAGALGAGTAAGAAGAAGAGLGALGAAAAPTAATAAMPALTGATTALAPTAATGAAAGLPSILAGTPMAGIGANAGAAGLTGATAANAAAPAATGAIGSSVLPGAGTAATLADAAGAAGVGGMAPAASSGGGGLASLFGGLDSGKLLQYGALGAMMLPKGGGSSDKEEKRSAKDIGAKQYERGAQAEAPDMGNQGGITREFNYFPNARYYADGGLASLASDKKSGAGDAELIDATVAALQGQAPNPDVIIQQFIQTFGPDALKDLIAQVQGSQAQSDGMSDSIPAQINGGLGSIAPAQISEGEYVVPADVVSHIGNGSTQAGAKQLEEMNNRVRSARGAGEPRQINPMQALPA